MVVTPHGFVQFKNIFLFIGVGGNATLGVRLVASTITSLLILSLLLFMIHRLRQRRLLITLRRMCLDMVS